MTTNAAKERAYRVLLHALAEERHTCDMTDEEFSRRSQEIWDDCFKSDRGQARRCDVCDGKGYIEANVHADARYFSPTPAATRVVCWKCKR